MAVTIQADCATQVLCSLSNAALNVLQTLISGQIALLQSQITFYQTQLLQYDVLAIPLQATQATLQALVNNVRNSAVVLPLQAITGCVQLGDFNINLQASIDAALGVAEDQLFEIERLVSFRSELQAIVNNLNNTITEFTNISNIITFCKQQNGAA